MHAIEISREHLKSNVESCLRQLLTHDRTLLDIDVHERTIASKLAGYLSNCYPQWDVDAEYNRDRYKAKHVSGLIRVIPDIIIHRRNTGENLLAIEIKTTSNVNEDNRREDYGKLISLQEEYGYNNILFLVLGVGKHTGAVELNWFDGLEWSKCIYSDL